MNTFSKATLIVLSAFGIGIFTPTPDAQAQMTQEKIRVTFSSPVEVPGEVLPAGTYVFEAVENGRLTRILNADEDHVYATLMTVPDETNEPADQPVVKLGENSEGSPMKVRAWFYPGETVGSEFLYTNKGAANGETQNEK